MKRTVPCIMLLVICATVLADCAPAQPAASTPVTTSCDPAAFTLSVRRNFGYGSGDHIKGNFGLSVNAPQDCISKVTYLLDEQTIQEVSQAPFGISFETTNYAYGSHQLTARVTLRDGAVFTTPARSFVFATAEEEKLVISNTAVPIVVGALGVILLVILLQFLLVGKNQKKVEPGTQRKYGISGGAICPKCGRPFVLGLISIHIGFRRFERCPNCGKWSWVSPAALADLRAAEQRELEAEKPQLPNQEKQAEDDLKKQIDDSKFVQ